MIVVALCAVGHYAAPRIIIMPLSPPRHAPARSFFHFISRRMAGKSKGRKSPQKRDKPVALVSADVLTDEELLGRKGSGTAFTASLIAAVIVGIVAIVLAQWRSSSSSTDNEIQRSPSAHAGIPSAFDHLNEINSIPYQLFVKADFTDAVDGNTKLPPLPENAFKNPYDIIPALAKAISDKNVAVCMQLVQLLLNEKSRAPWEVQLRHPKRLVVDLVKKASKSAHNPAQPRSIEMPWRMPDFCGSPANRSTLSKTCSWHISE